MHIVITNLGKAAVALQTLHVRFQAKDKQSQHSEPFYSCLMSGHKDSFDVESKVWPTLFSDGEVWVSCDFVSLNQRHVADWFVFSVRPESNDMRFLRNEPQAS